ncbi:hypothetical protein D3C87_2090100 [compost metagenome]
MRFISVGLKGSELITETTCFDLRTFLENAFSLSFPWSSLRDSALASGEIVVS